MFKYEMHLHSYQGSKCARSQAHEYIDFYKSLGYSGVVLTDHFYHGNCRPSRELEWKEFIEENTQGYYELKKAAEGKDFGVFFGIEEHCGNWDEYLIYGLEPKWLAEHPELRDISRIDFLKLVKANGAFVVQAHPYRYRPYFKTNMITISSSYVDAYEVFNSCNIPEQNKLAYELAKLEKKLMISGSDRHAIDIEIPIGGGIALPRRAETIFDIINGIKQGEATALGVETLEGLPENIEFDHIIEFI